MAKRITIGVLSPLLDGLYFGRLFSGIQSIVEEEGARLLGIQTMDDHTEFTSTNYDYPLARDLVDGWIVVLNAVREPYLQELVRTKPLVSISSFRPGSNYPVILPDNRGGTAEAVRHLLDHGHRRIAFTGYVEQIDIQQRFDGYRLALQERDITYDPDLFYPAKDNLTSGGTRVARQMLKARVPFTALIAGTDMNALGIMDMLKAAGYRIPEDIAIVGFDDINEARNARPSLTSIRQPFDEVGRTAARLLLARIEGKEVPAGSIYAPTILIKRASCGCSPREQTVSTNVEVDVPENLTSLFTPIMENTFRIMMELVGQYPDSGKSLSWLRWTPVQWACLGLWNREKTNENELIIDQTFFAGSDRTIMQGSRYELKAFPPFDHYPEDKNDIIILYPIKKTPSPDWGILALACPITDLPFLQLRMLRQWSDLVALALEREEMEARLKRREEELKRKIRHLDNAHTQVVEANRILERKEKLQDEFLLLTGQELRSGLNTIIGIADSSTEGLKLPLPDKTGADFSTITRNARKLAILVNEILDYTRLKGKK